MAHLDKRGSASIDLLQVGTAQASAWTKGKVVKVDHGRATVSGERLFRSLGFGIQSETKRAHLVSV